MAKSKKSKLSLFAKLKKWLKNPKNRPNIIILAIAVLIVGFWCYQSVAKWQDKRKFEQARTSIDQLYNDIVAKVGQPDNYKKSSSCSRPNLKFEQGPLSCDVDVSFIYGVNDENEALGKMHNIQEVIKTHKDFKLKNSLSTKFDNAIINNQINSKTVDQYIKQGLDCYVVYEHIQDLGQLTAIDLNRAASVKTTINCTGDARREYFPMTPA